VASNHTGNIEADSAGSHLMSVDPTHSQLA